MLDAPAIEQGTGTNTPLLEAAVKDGRPGGGDAKDGHAPGGGGGGKKKKKGKK